MLFQHYVTDDFRGCQELLTKNITVDNLQRLLDHVREGFVVFEQCSDDGNKFLHIDIDRMDKFLMYGVPLHVNSNGRTEYNSLQDWIDAGGIPIIVTLSDLRYDYPGLHMLNDLQAAQLVYASIYPTVPESARFGFLQGNDNINHFIEGYKEYGVRSDFYGQDVSMSKVQYLIMRGEEVTKYGKPITY